MELLAKWGWRPKSELTLLYAEIAAEPLIRAQLGDKPERKGIVKIFNSCYFCRMFVYCKGLVTNVVM